MKHGKSILALLLTLTCLAPLAAQSKPRLAVLPFTGGSGDDGNTISLLLSNQKEIRSIFTVVPRNDNAIKAVFKEQNIQRSGLTDSDTISELGKQLNADFVVAGHIQKLGSKNLILITIVNVETLQQIAGDFKEYGKIEEVRVLLPDMTKKITAAAKTTTAQVPKLAVLPFDIPKDVNVTDAEVLAQLLATEVANTGRYAVLPRTKTIETVMEEQNIQRSGLTDASSIKALGKATNADYVLAGNIMKLGETLNLFLVQILSVESGELLEGSDVEYQTMADGLKLMPQLSEKLTGIKGIQPTGVTAMPQPAAQKADASGNKTYQIGDFGPAGGIVFYDKGVVSNGWRYLEAAPPELEFKAAWGAYKKDVKGTSTSVGSGKSNTEIIVAYLKSIGETDKAAQLAVSTSFDGYTDWFLPSKDELNLMYKNLKAKGLGGFGNGWYWSSSQGSTDTAWVQRFSDGIQDYDYKDYSNSVRVVRAF